MLITGADPIHVQPWLALADEVGTGMNAAELSDFVSERIAAREAIVAVDRDNRDLLVAAAAFSRGDNAVTWFGVANHPGIRSAGCELLECVLNQLDRSIRVTAACATFQQPNSEPAFSILVACGFAAQGGTTDSALVRDPEPNPSGGGSFHYKYDRWCEWSNSHACPVCRDESPDPDYVLIAELGHSWVGTSMAAQGRLYGNCHVLCKQHFVELFDMPEADLLAFMKDVQAASRALKHTTGAVKINYELHGNTMPHIHVHLFPRYLNDMFPSGPIDYRITAPDPYGSDQAFQGFVSRLRRELALKRTW